MTDAPLVSVVVPVYNSPDLAALVARIDDAFRGRFERHEIVLVDDASPDGRIWPTLEQLACDHEHVTAVQLTRNFGQHSATLCGLAIARGDLVITMDDDLQHDAADIAALLEQSEHDIVIAQFSNKQHPFVRRLASRIKGRFDELVIGKPRGLQLSSFRLIRRPVVDGVLSLRTPRPFLPALLFHISSDVAGVPLTHGRRAAGRSGYTLRKLLRLFSDLLISNSSLLLRLAASGGLVLAIVSFGLAAAVVYRKVVHRIAVTGWTSLFAALMLIGGLILLTLGTVGEYLIRIIESSEARPAYYVRRKTKRAAV